MLARSSVPETTLVSVTRVVQSRPEPALRRSCKQVQRGKRAAKFKLNSVRHPVSAVVLARELVMAGMLLEELKCLLLLQLLNCAIESDMEKFIRILESWAKVSVYGILGILLIILGFMAYQFFAGADFGYKSTDVLIVVGIAALTIIIFFGVRVMVRIVRKH
ncbi:MAG: hypothetical protein V4579_02745 [Pseudomonadota bacterium]